MNHTQKLLEMMKFLRTHADGCAWTKAQTHQSIATNFIEETYEALEAIDHLKDDDLRDELGDVLLQIAFHAQIADERGAFNFDDVAKAITDKLERRYPSIFGDEPNTIKTPEGIAARWDQVKAAERLKKGIKPEDTSVLDGISHGIPALMRLQKVKSRIADTGWKWHNVEQILEKIEEELAELRAEINRPNINRMHLAAELGDVISGLVDIGNWYSIDVEDAARLTSNRIEKRFRHMERGLKALGKDFKTSSQEERLSLWAEAKAEEKKQKQKTA